MDRYRGRMHNGACLLYGRGDKQDCKKRSMIESGVAGLDLGIVMVDLMRLHPSVIVIKVISPLLTKLRFHIPCVGAGIGSFFKAAVASARDSWVAVYFVHEKRVWTPFTDISIVLYNFLFGQPP